MALNALRIETIPSDEEIREFYNAVAALGPMEAGMYRSPPQINRLARIKEMLTLILPWARIVLEMGCCDGWLTEWMAPRTEYILAFDLAEACIDRVRAASAPSYAHVDCVSGDLEYTLTHTAWDSFDPYGSEFGLAIASEVLEHCPDPEAVVKRLGEVAHGILASVPIRETPSPGAFSVEAFQHPKRGGDGTGHIWCFRRDSFKSLFTEIWHYEEIMGCSAIILGR